MSSRMLAAIAAIAVTMTASAWELTPATKIVIPDMDRTGVVRALKEAADELALDVGEATGWKLAVVEASKAGDTAGAILLGEKFAADAGLVPPDLKFFDNVIAEKDGRIYLFGHDRPCRKGNNLVWTNCILASVKALCDFEYRFLGVKRILPGRTGTEVPKAAKVAVPDGFRRVSRPTQENGTGRYYGMMYSIANNIFGNGTYRTYGGHIYHHVFKAEKYLETHPEYYAVIGGKMTKKVKTQPAICFSQPDVKRLLIEQVVQDFDNGADVVEFGQQDSSECCECEKCRAFGGPDATPGEKFWIFHRDIAAELYRLRPEKTVQLIAYAVTDCVPKSFTEFTPNVMVELMTYSDEVYEAWKRVKVPRGFSVYTYMWGEYQSPGLTCKMSTHVMARLARRFARHGVRSIYRCGYGESFGTEGPASYVFNQLLADPSLDENALLEEYLVAAYGPATPHMRKFHKAFDERVAAWAECFNNDRRWPWPRENSGQNTIVAIYTPDMLGLCEASLTAAEKTPGISDKTKRRLELVRHEFANTRLLAETCMLYDAYRIAPSEPLFEAIASRVEKRRALVETFFDAKGKEKPIAGWPEYLPFGTRCTKDLVLKNGRLFAPLYAPFNWDIPKMRASLAKTLKPEQKTTKASVDRQQSPWNEIGGMDGGSCSYATKFRCSRDDGNFYVEVDAELPDSLKFSPVGHDGPAYRQECLELFIDPTFTRNRSFHFLWNPVENSFFDEAFGVSTDPLDPEADRFQPSWDGRWDYRTWREKGRWHSVVRIPFATLGVKKPSPGTKWCINVGRESFIGDETQFQLWGRSQSGAMNDLQAMGTVEF